MTDELDTPATEAPELPGPFDSLAVRTVSEDDNVHIIEGRAVPYGGPFNGKDSYGTFFSVRSDLGIEPDIPIKLWYNHGFDPDFGFSTIGKTTSVRTEDDGIWVEAQLNKRHKYYEERVKPLLEKKALGFSAGSAEHSYHLDEKSGEILTYPIHEISLTPTEANPWAQMATRSAEVVTILAARTEPPAEPEPDPMTDALAGAESALAAVRALLDTDAVRAGARNSQKDLTRINAIQQHASAITGHASALGAKSNDDPRSVAPAPQSPTTSDTPAASRSADSLPMVTILERDDVAAIRSLVADLAAQVGRETARGLTG
ncbi:MAG: hypothetical protein NVS9B1_25370 [Candidatus Dormibacteraceae bacterium]